jgi:hypothetical protein
MIRWCEENVGELLWSRPIIEWHGKGWHIKNASIPDSKWSKRTIRVCEITIDDEQLLTQFVLRWA